MLNTDRLEILELSFDDSDFILTLVNEPDFKKYIGDKGVRTLDDAREYLRNGPIASYAINGFGLFLVCRKDDGTRLGICGLVKRDQFEVPDLGFAFLEQFRANGYACEASLAVIAHARQQLGLKKIIAVVNKENASSLRLLEKLQFQYEKMVRMPGETQDICRYGLSI